MSRAESGAAGPGDALAARFFTDSDERADTLVFPLPAPWWSRPYEYAWCAGFARPDDVALDAACGISHPFKFYLADRCREAHACDWDARIESETEILLDVVRDFGKGAAESLMRSSSLSRLRRACQHRVAAVSGRSIRHDLLHLGVGASVRRRFGRIARGIQPNLEAGRETRADLRFSDGGPDALSHAGIGERFRIRGRLRRGAPSDAVSSDLWGRLYCYRAVLRKR